MEGKGEDNTDYRGLAVFDIDGTIADTVEIHQTSLLAAMESFGIPRLNTNWSDYPNHTDAAIFDDAWLAGFGRPPSNEEREEFYRRMNADFDSASERASIREIAGATRFLESVRRERWGIAFATGGLRALSIKKLKALGVDFTGDILATSSESPARRALVSAAIASASRFYGFTPKTIVSFGDGRWDLETATALGLSFIGVGKGVKADYLRAHGAFVMPDFTNLPAAMEALAKI
jgi:phosphoglycolate phosphatase-like HAD superfamily hydrolase